MASPDQTEDITVRYTFNPGLNDAQDVASVADNAFDYFKEHMHIEFVSNAFYEKVLDTIEAGNCCYYLKNIDLESPTCTLTASIFALEEPEHPMHPCVLPDLDMTETYLMFDFE